MQFRLENLKYQTDAINSVVDLFDGCERNHFDNATQNGIRFNWCNLTAERIAQNRDAVLKQNGIASTRAYKSQEPDFCIEMETGTGKTLVYLQTIYALAHKYQFTKFIILVPSVAIRQGVVSSFQAFGSQLEEKYRQRVHLFEYESKKLSRVRQFVEEQTVQVMVMTLAAFNSDDKILNQEEREGLFANQPYIKAIGQTRPIILMDEPQEGMDTPNSLVQIAKLSPLLKLRYSATHKVMRNLLFKLSPAESYKQGLVKKIEVLTVTEKHEEAALKIEVVAFENQKGKPKVKLKAWHQSKSTSKIEFKETGWLTDHDNLEEKTYNPGYQGYIIRQVNKSLRTGKWQVSFTNDVTLTEQQRGGDLRNVWNLQIEWLLHRHFAKSLRLAPQGIKCLSLIFIDRVANYIGEQPIIKQIFNEKFAEIYPQYFDTQPSTELILKAQGYYFAQKQSGEYADSEGGAKEQAKIYDLILRDKESLLSLDNPVQFIFSHSALGVGWDNPNVFNIATLNNSYSDVKKRQEIGRGLRICVNQQGQRVYDQPDTPLTEKINLLTVVPNETYETFVAQYQSEINTAHGDMDDTPVMMKSEKGQVAKPVIARVNRKDDIQQAFRAFWKKIALKTDYTVAFDEEKLIAAAVQRLQTIRLPDYTLEASGFIVNSIDDFDTPLSLGTETVKKQIASSPIDILEELSENTGLSYLTVTRIMERLTNLDQCAKNPPRFVHEASVMLRQVALDEMLRATSIDDQQTLKYVLTGQHFPYEPEDIEFDPNHLLVHTPNKGLYDHMQMDSYVERTFAMGADSSPATTNADLICFLKLPDFYKIKTPLGHYTPDFGVVMKRRSLRTHDESEFYFIVETKGTSDPNAHDALTPAEVFKMRCAVAHFRAVGLDVHYHAPVHDYNQFHQEARNTMDTQPPLTNLS